MRIPKGFAVHDKASEAPDRLQPQRGATASRDDIESPQAARLLSLQRRAGNAAVTGMLTARRTPLPVQRHTAVGLEYEENSVQMLRLPGASVQRDLVDDLNDAMAGWGTDEDAMRKAIAAASAAEKRDALRDPRLLRRMQDELSSSELREMLTGLDAPLALRLEASMMGWGADADEIVLLCKSAPAAEKLEVLRNPRLMERLRDELNSDDAVSVMEHLDAPIAQRLYAAMGGWGVDVGEVVRICSNATKAEKLEAARDRALIDRLKEEISQPYMMHAVLETLGVSLIDRLHTAMDGWGVDSAEILRLAHAATAAEKATVLGDRATITRLRDELSNADMLTVLRDLDASVAHRLDVALGGWGVAPETVNAIVTGADEAQRMAAYADTALVERMREALDEEAFDHVLLLLRFGSQAAIDAASEEELADTTAPDNLTALLSTSLDAAPPDTAKMLTDITAAGAADKALVRSNAALLQRVLDAFAGGERATVQQQLGVSLVDQLTTLIEQESTLTDFTALLSTATADAKAGALANRALLDRLTEHLGADAQGVLSLLGDTLRNQLLLALEQGADVDAMLALIEAATSDQRDAVRVDAVLLGQITEKLSPVATWRIRLRLVYGSAAAYPAGTQTLLTAVDASTAHADVQRTIANLTDAEFAGIRDIVGLRDMLQRLYSDSEYLFLLRMLDEGLINEHTENDTWDETLQNDDPSKPGNIFEPMVYHGTTAFDVAQMRDRLQVDMRILMKAGDDGAESKMSTFESRLEPLIEGIWDNAYSLRNANRTIPIRINCNFTSDSPHHTINVYAKSTGVKYGEYNLSNWYPDATGFSNLAPAHEFGHMLGNRDEYNLSAADYLGTVGTAPNAASPGVTKDTDDVGNERFTNDSVMGGNAAGRVDKRHLNYFVNWMNSNRRKRADGTFVEPAFSLV